MVSADTMTTKNDHEEENFKKSSTISMSSSTRSFCCDECGLVKNDMRNVREELRFLTHQVSRLMNVFDIKHCPCQICSYTNQQNRPQIKNTTLCAGLNLPVVDDYHTLDQKASKELPTMGAVTCNIFEQKPIDEDQLLAHCNGGSPISKPDPDPLYIRKFSHPESVIAVDQLLPKLIASDHPIMIGDSRKRSLDSNASSATFNGEDAGTRDTVPIMSDQSPYTDFPPPLRKLAKLDFTHLARSLENCDTNGNIEQSCFLTKRISPTMGVTSIELPKNCIDGADTRFEPRFVQTSGLLPTVPSTVFQFRHDYDERYRIKDFSPTLPTIGGAGLPLVSYGPKSSTFFCGVCKREFSNVYYKRHMIVHANARPHVCDVCGKRFNERSNMMKHRQRLHV